MKRHRLLSNGVTRCLTVTALATIPLAATQPPRNELQVSSSIATQKRPYNLVMKEVGSTFASLRKKLEGGELAAAEGDARTLERLFAETAAFWAPFRTKDAIDAATGAREASGTIAAAAKDGDQQKARTAVTGLGRFCTTCHDSHREQMPDKTYRIRP